MFLNCRFVLFIWKCSSIVTFLECTNTSTLCIKPLQEKAQKTLKGLKVSNIVFNVDDGSSIKESKFDAILSAAAPLEVPFDLKEKLSIGGRMIIPVGDNSKQVLTLVTRVSKKEFQETKVEDVLFVPLLKGVVS